MMSVLIISHFEGKTYAEIGELYPEDQKLWKENWKEFCPSGGESFVMFYNRVKSFMEYIIKLKEENILQKTQLRIFEIGLK